MNKKTFEENIQNKIRDLGEITDISFRIGDNFIEILLYTPYNTITFVELNNLVNKIVSLIGDNQYLGSRVIKSLIQNSAGLIISLYYQK